MISDLDGHASREEVKRTPPLKGARMDRRPGILFAAGMLLIGLGLLVCPLIIRLKYPHEFSESRFSFFFWSLTVLFVSTGLALIRYRSRIRFCVRHLLCGLGVLGVFITVDEIVLDHAYDLWGPGPDFVFIPDSATGWSTRADDRWSRDVDGYGTVDYSTQRDGFRCYGDLDSERMKILVLGDSFTHAIEVSDGQAYYDLFRMERPAVEVFAYGTRGYNTVQEYLALDRFHDAIQPDLVLLQIHTTDFLDNPLSNPLRAHLFTGAPRPCWEEGRIVWCNTRLLGSFGDESGIVKLTKQVVHRVVNLRRRFRPEGWAEGSVEETQSVKSIIRVMSDLLAKFRTRTGDTPVAAFLAAGLDWEDALLQRLSTDAGIVFIPGVASRIREAKERGDHVDGGPRDAHWSRRGHEIAGRYLIEALRERGLMPAAK